MRFALLAAVALAACSPGTYTPTFSPIDSDGHDLRDAEGRVKIYRGVNVHIAGIFDVTFDDGRAPREALPTFDASDPIDMHARGFNLVRLPIDWSAIEPTRGQFADDYLDRVAGIVAWCRAAGVDVLLDLHEDGWSKELCEDGAPLWAVIPPPAMLTGGPVPGPDCHATPPAIDAFNSFWDDAAELQEAYLDMLAHVAARFRDDPGVIGYEVMNEPLGEEDTVQAFQQRAAATLRAADAKKLIVFEPVAERNFTNASPISSVPFSVPGAVYAVHIYTAIFANGSALTDGTYPQLLSDSIAGARDEADGWHTPLAVTEYGLGSATPQGPDWIGHALDDFDAVGASSTWWLWKDPTPGGWGLFDPEADGSYTPRPVMMDAISRPYAVAIGGDAPAVAWDGATLTVKFHGRGDVPARHDIFWNRGTPAIACDGKPVTADSVDAANSLYVVRCGGGGAHTLTFAQN